MINLEIKNGYGRVKVGNREYSVSQIDGLWNLRCQDYSGKYLVDFYIVENKKRLSTIQKYADKYEINIQEVK